MWIFLISILNMTIKIRKSTVDQIKLKLILISIKFIWLTINLRIFLNSILNTFWPLEAKFGLGGQNVSWQKSLRISFSIDWYHQIGQFQQNLNLFSAQQQEQQEQQEQEQQQRESFYGPRDRGQKKKYELEL